MGKHPKLRKIDVKTLSMKNLTPMVKPSTRGFVTRPTLARNHNFISRSRSSSMSSCTVTEKVNNLSPISTNSNSFVKIINEISANTENACLNGVSENNSEINEDQFSMENSLADKDPDKFSGNNSEKSFDDFQDNRSETSFEDPLSSKNEKSPSSEKLNFHFPQAKSNSHNNKVRRKSSEGRKPALQLLRRHTSERRAREGSPNLSCPALPKEGHLLHNVQR